MREWVRMEEQATIVNEEADFATPQCIADEWGAGRTPLRSHPTAAAWPEALQAEWMGQDSASWMENPHFALALQRRGLEGRRKERRLALRPSACSTLAHRRRPKTPADPHVSRKCRAHLLTLILFRRWSPQRSIHRWLKKDRHWRAQRSG